MRYGVGIKSHDEIDRVNILKATMLAMSSAVAQIPTARQVCASERCYEPSGMTESEEEDREGGVSLQIWAYGANFAMLMALAPDSAPDYILIDGNRCPGDLSAPSRCAIPHTFVLTPPSCAARDLSVGRALPLEGARAHACTPLRRRASRQACS